MGVELSRITISDLGRAQKVTVDKEYCTIIRGAGKKADIQARLRQLKRELETTTSDYDREKLEERVAKLSGGVARINVGAATELELRHKKARFEDALHATRAAVEEGILPGGGVALARASSVIESMKLKGDERIGGDIVRRALFAPLMQIATNAGYDGRMILEKVLQNKNPNFGFDAEKGELVDMYQRGIVDPTKVVRSEIQNAASVASLLLTTEALVADMPEKEEEEKEK
jgi:chaperonin GroEL